MKPMTFISGGLTVAACLLSGCGKSSSNSSDAANNAQSPAPASAPASPAPNAPRSALPAPVVETPQPVAGTVPPTIATTTATAPAAAEPVSQFATTAAAQTDKVAASIGSELADKASSLTRSTQADPELKSQVSSALQSLSAGKDASALTTLFQQAKQSNLTPQQTQLVKDVGHLASAYVVQRNFSSVDGAQGDVATIVNSLRKGSITPAVPALQSLAQNASLTPQQKDLLGTVAEQYAPGLKKASDSLK